MSGALKYGILLVVPLMLAMGVMVFLAQVAASCDDSAGLQTIAEGGGSLGGVLGTGITKEEILAARRHPLGGTKVTENQYRSTAYAPAAGGINCASGGSCMSTASGIKVNNGKRKAYLIATNPKLNAYGSLVWISPNPYGWSGPFVVADTGGNFDGSDGTYRIDFYMWGSGGQKAAMDWGSSRMVQVSSRPITTGNSGRRVLASSRQVAAGADNPVKFRRPTSGPITSGFGQRWGRAHEGVDIAPAAGTPIVAALGGRVIYAGPMGGYGNYVCIRHAQTLTTCYAHQERFASGIKVGVVVRQSQLIGFVGNTGNSTGPHLHFEVRKGPSASSPATDPAPYLAGSESVIPSDSETAEQASGQCPGGAGGEAPDGQGVAAVAAVADWMDKQKFPYCYGGGHMTPSKPSASRGDGMCTHADGSLNGKGSGFDCSSSTSFILQHAGVDVETMTSGGFMSWGKAGEGEHVSIYANPSHVFLKINGRFFSTSVSNYRSGPGWVPASIRSTAGFVVRHPEGM